MNDTNLQIDDEFNFSKFLYLSLNESMKNALDMGTLLSDDATKLRAFKEQIKKNYRSQWVKISTALIGLGLADPCMCKDGSFCQRCAGSRIIPSLLADSPEFTESGIAISASADEDKVIAALTNIKESTIDQVPKV